MDLEWVWANGDRIHFWVNYSFENWMCKQALHKMPLRNDGKIKNITQLKNVTPKLSQKMQHTS